MLTQPIIAKCSLALLELWSDDLLSVACACSIMDSAGVFFTTTLMSAQAGLDVVGFVRRFVAHSCVSAICCVHR